MRLLFALVFAVLVAGCATTTPSTPTPGPPPAASAPDGLPSIASKTATMERQDGFFPLYWDAREGKVWLEIPALDTDFLYAHSLVAGLGSNDVGLDRSQLGFERIVRFERVGPRAFLVRPNLNYRATTDNPAERQAVEDAFAEGIEWGFDIVAETDGRLLVDATAFVVRDVHGVARTLQRTNQGSFRLASDRSALVPDRLNAFPQNTELEARLTFTSDDPGRYVWQTAADPYAVTVRVRHSFIALPPPGYEPRAFDPRSGYFPLSYADYGVPIGEELTQRLITRHRLQCADTPGPDGLCTPVEPIVYYLDPGTPEPVRSALLDGARWWAEAFEAAGFRDGYRVEVLPADADPMDVRYNVIQWVHRATRGWSYGSSVVDPRTGEILKGHVLLGSLRVRQDYLIAEGLLAPYTGANTDGFAPDDDPMLAMALARLRQLSAHEVGHTIGIAHNFAASTNSRASVMDYPAPLAVLAPDGSIDLSEAYDVGIGAWDIQTVRYGYAPQDGAPAAVLAENEALGLDYLSDSDARPPGAASPTAALWDNGTDAVQMLNDEMAVRRVALERFSEAAVRDGRPMATLEEALVPLYLRHRYQVEGTAKLLGGVDYAYTMRGEGSPGPEPVSAATQQAALDALLATLTPDALRLPDAVLGLIPPRPPGYYDGRELFDGRTDPAFDPYAPAETVAGLVFGLILNPERAARLAYQHDRDAALPGFEAVLERIHNALQAMDATDATDDELRRLVLTGWIDALLTLAADTDAAVPVRARTEAYLRAFASRTPPDGSLMNADAAHLAWLTAEVARFLDRDYDPDLRPDRLTTPPGSPIGTPGFVIRQQRRHAVLDRFAPETACGF